MQAGGADEICRGQLAEKSFQRETRTSDRGESEKLMEMFPGKGGVGKRSWLPSSEPESTMNRHWKGSKYFECPPFPQKSV